MECREASTAGFCSHTRNGRLDKELPADSCPFPGIVVPCKERNPKKHHRTVTELCENTEYHKEECTCIAY